MQRREDLYLRKMSVVRGLLSALLLGAALFYGMAECITFATNRSTIYCSDLDCFQRNLGISKLEFFNERLGVIALCQTGVNIAKQIKTEAENFFNQKCSMTSTNYIYSKTIIEKACWNQWKILGVRVTYNCLSVTTASQTGYNAAATGVTYPFLTNRAFIELSNYTPTYSQTINTGGYQDIDSENNLFTDLEYIGLTTRITANRSLDDKLTSSLNSTNTGGDTIVAAVCTSAGCLAILLVAAYSWRRKLWRKCLPRLRGHDQQDLSPHHAETDRTTKESGECSYENCQTSQLERSTNVPKVALSHGTALSQVEKCANKFVERNFEDVYNNVESLRTGINHKGLVQESRDANTAVSEVQYEKEKENYENSYFSQSRDSTYFVLEQVSGEPSTVNSLKAISPTKIMIRAETELQDTAKQSSFDFNRGNNHAALQADDLVNAENDLYVSCADP